MADKLLTIGEVAYRCGVSHRSVLRWLSKGKSGRKLKRSGNGKVWESDLRRFLTADQPCPREVTDFLVGEGFVL